MRVGFAECFGDFSKWTVLHRKRRNWAGQGSVSFLHYYLWFHHELFWFCLLIDGCSGTRWFWWTRITYLSLTGSWFAHFQSLAVDDLCIAWIMAVEDSLAAVLLQSRMECLWVLEYGRRGCWKKRTRSSLETWENERYRPTWENLHLLINGPRSGPKRSGRL